MDEKPKKGEKRIMLVIDAKSGKVKAVKDIDKNGNAKTVEPTPQNAENLLNVNTHDSALEAFFKKMMEQAKNPAHTGIFMMAANVFDKLFKIDFDPEIMNNYRVDPANELRNFQFQPHDLSKIDRADMERKGISMEAIEPYLRAMSYGHKSHALVEMNPELEPGGVRVPTKGRVSLEEQPDGSLRVVPHYFQEKPNLDAPLYGVMLPDDVKANLAETRHAGRLVDLELTPGKIEPCFISVDKLTNRLEVLPLSALEQRNSIKNVTLDEDTARKLFSGEKILLEKFTTRDGYFRDGYIRVDASNRNFEFSYDGLDRNRYAQENREIFKQRVAEGKIEPRHPNRETSEETKAGLTIHKHIKGVEVPEKAYKEWTEANKNPEKRSAVNYCYMKGMTDEKGQKFNAWVKPDWENNKFDFRKYNPKYAKSKGAEVTPATESKTQVDVNTHGKTNEGSKHSQAKGQPLQQGKDKPTDTQQKQGRQYQRPPAKRTAPEKGMRQGGQKI